MRTKTRVLLPAGALAAIILAAACAPPTKPPVKPPPTTAPSPYATSCPAAAGGNPGPDTSTPISSWGVDGAGFATAVIGNVVYVGGAFTHAVSPTGVVGPARLNLAAFCLASGKLLSTFNANVNGPVNALATDGTTLFVGGNFSTLNGQAVTRLVKVNALTGARITQFNTPIIPAPVNSLAFFGGNIYAGGDFGKLNASAPFVQVGNAAGFNGLTGQYNGWHAGADKTIEAIAISPDGNWVYIGGNFLTVGLQPHDRLAKLSRAAAGAVQPVVYSNVSAGVLGARPLDIVATSGHLLVGIGPAASTAPAGAGRRMIYFDDATGNAIWNDTNPRGDVQAVTVVGNRVYFGMPKGYNACVPANSCRLIGANITGSPFLTFAPFAVSGGFGVEDLATGANRLVAVGDFTTIGANTDLHGLAIFS
jgi:hypothetical protein